MIFMQEEIMPQLIHVTHEFKPLYDSSSEILILGSIPSPKSREQGFYYGHPQNRFWKVMAQVLGEDVPVTIEEKKNLMLGHRIALWDALEECDICGASDSSNDYPLTGIEAVRLQSTSSTNVEMSIERLVEEYKVINKQVKINK